MRKTDKVLAGVMSSIMTIASLSTGAVFTQADASTKQNYAEALQKSLYFYDANMCGEDVDDNTLTWRKNCHTYDSEIKLDTNSTNLSSSDLSKYKSALDPDGNGTVDLSGGYHDAGDFAKFGLPAAYTCSTIAWGMYEFPDAFKETKTETHAKDILRRFCDYFIKCTFLDESGNAVAFCYQVGDGGLDHSTWRGPETDTASSMPRKAFFITADGNPSSDICYETAAALASCAVIFKDDASYAEKLTKYAEAVYNLGKKCGSSITYDGCSAFYSSDTYKDDKAWSEVWLNLATGESSYLNEAKNCSEYDGWVHCWGKVMGGYYCMMQSVTGDSSWKSKVVENINRLGNESTTPQGYNAIGGGWGSARYNTSYQLYTLAYAKETGDTQYVSKAQKQMDYLLGENNLGQSYLIGYGNKYPTHPHHRGSGQNLKDANDTGDQLYTLWGALVGGPGGDDSYQDITSDYNKNEVALDYNASCVGALAGLYEFVGKEAGNEPIADFSNDEIKLYYGGHETGGQPTETQPTETQPTETTTESTTTEPTTTQPTETQPTTTTTTTSTTSATTTSTSNGGNSGSIGDVNGDGRINIADLFALAQHVAAISTLEGDSLTNADVNGDNRVNIADLFELAQEIAS